MELALMMVGKSIRGKQLSLLLSARMDIRTHYNLRLVYEVDKARSPKLNVILRRAVTQTLIPQATYAA